MDIAVGTKNPAKITAVKQAYTSDAEKIITVDIPSRVSKQPFSDEETITGAINRAQGAMVATNSDIGIGLEGGVQELHGGLYVCNWGALVAKGMNKPLIAGGARIPLPRMIADRLLTGEELGTVMADIANRQNVSKKEGAIGILTNGLLDRKSVFYHIVNLLKGQYEYYQNETAHH